MSTLMPPAADLLADIEHRRFVALALADHHRAVDGQDVEGAAHRLHRGLVGGVLVAASDLARGRHRRRFGDANRFQRERTIEMA